MKPVLATLVISDESLDPERIVILDANDAVIWRGWIGDPRLIDVLAEPRHKIRMHPSAVDRAAAYATSRGHPPIVHD